MLVHRCVPSWKSHIFVFSNKNPRQEITQLTYKFHLDDIGKYLGIFSEFVLFSGVRSFDVESTVNWELVPVLFRRPRSPRVALRVVCPPSLACVRVFCSCPSCHRIRDYSQYLNFSQLYLINENSKPRVIGLEKILLQDHHENFGNFCKWTFWSQVALVNFVIGIGVLLDPTHLFLP